MQLRRHPSGPVRCALYRRIPLRGTTTAARPTGCLTTAEPPVATQPARYTPRAQTTPALASIVLKAVKPANSNTETTRCITLSPGLRWTRNLVNPLSPVCSKLLTPSSFMSRAKVTALAMLPKPGICEIRDYPKYRARFAFVDTNGSETLRLGRPPIECS